MKKNIRYWVLLTCIVVLTGCDVKILKDKDEETVGKEKENIRLYVTEEKKEKDINEIPTNLYQVKKEEEYSIFKDQENNFYITIDNIYYEKEDAMAYIYKNNLLDFGEKYKVEESLKEITQEKVEFKIYEDEELTTHYETNEEDGEIVLEDKKEKISIIVKEEKENEENVEEKENEENVEEKVLDENKEMKKNKIMSYAQQSYYKDVEWIEESQRMIDYANERWNVIEEKNELIANISGNDYLESVIKKYTDEKYRKISKEIKDSNIRITQYKNEGEYELEYMVYNEKKNKTIKKIIIKQKKKEELMEN